MEMSYRDIVCTADINGMPCTNRAILDCDGYTRCSDHKDIEHKPHILDIDKIESFAKNAGWTREGFQRCHYCRMRSRPTI